MPLKSRTKVLPLFTIIPMGAALGDSRPVLIIVSEMPSLIPKDYKSTESTDEDSLPFILRSGEYLIKSAVLPEGQ